MPEQVKCPHCKQRLFDLWSKGVELDIKCAKCRKVVAVRKSITYVHTEQRNLAV